MKSTRRFLALALCLVICLALFPASASAASGNIMASGTIGGTMEFKLYTNGDLVISGQGVLTDMSQWSFTNSPPYNPGLDDVMQTKSETRNLVIGEGITQVSVTAFRDCPNLTTVSLPESLMLIDDGAFSNCSALRSISIPNSVSVIGAGAFQGCTRLTNVYLPNNGNTQISAGAFQDCTSLASITIPPSIQSIQANAFRDCNSLKEIIFLGNYVSTGWIAPTAFLNVKADAYYPVDNDSWNQEKQNFDDGLVSVNPFGDFGGRLNWNASGDYTENNGWVQKNGFWYYYMNGVMVRSNWVAYEGRWFYFGENGRMYTGRQKIGDKYYYFNPTTGARMSGWQANEFYDDDGVWQPSYSGVNDSGLNMFRNGWQQSSDGKWFYIKNQAKLKGWIKWKNNWYYLDPTTGAMVTGWLTWEGNTYYLNPPNGEMIAGQSWTVGGTAYTFDKEGRLQGGKMDQNPLNLATGWRNVGGAWYFYRSDGTMIAGEWELIDGGWYYFNSNGKVKTGWLNWNGDWYYLEPGTGKMLTGFQQISTTPQGVNLAAPKTYFFKSNGALNGKGWIQVGKKWFYLRDDGSIATGWIKDGKNWFYLDDGTSVKDSGVGYSYGEMVTGAFTVPATCDGKPNDQPGLHSFKANGVWLGAGDNIHKSVAGGWSGDKYLDADGVPLSGWQYIDGKWYYLNPSNDNKKAKGWVNDGSNWYYCDGNGVMLKGWQQIDGTWYLLDGNGARVTGWHQGKDGKWYYLNPDNGGMVNDITMEIDGEYWKFNHDGVCTGKVA